MQVARAAAIAASEAGQGRQLFANGPGNAAFQIPIGPGNDLMHQFTVGQEIIYMPSSGLVAAVYNRGMTVQALETARAPG